MSPSPDAPARRILLVNQHYWPDIAATGQYLTDLGEHLAREGYDVEVLCGRARYVAGQMEVPAEETRNGVHIRRFLTTAFGRGSNVGRILDYATYYVRVLAALLGGGRYDLVIVLTTPPLLAVAAAVAKRVRGQRYGIWSMDLHPDAEEALGMLMPGSPPARILHALNDFGYRQADFVVALGPCMRDRILQKGVAPERLYTIPVWMNQDEVEPIPKEANPLAAEMDLKGRFVVMYSGNAGLAHRFDEVLETMLRLKDDPRFFFLFVGAGPRRAEIEAFAAEHGLEHFAYRDYFPREQLRESLSLGDVHLLTLRDDMAGIAVPSKLYGIMAAERPVVMVGPARSGPAQTIRQSGGGVVIDPATEPDATDRFEAALRHLAGDAERRAALGRAGREAFLSEYEQDIACAAWTRLVVQETGSSTA